MSILNVARWEVFFRPVDPGLLREDLKVERCCCSQVSRQGFAPTRFQYWREIYLNFIPYEEEDYYGNRDLVPDYQLDQ